MRRVNTVVDIYQDKEKHTIATHVEYYREHTSDNTLVVRSTKGIDIEINIHSEGEIIKTMQEREANITDGIILRYYNHTHKHVLFNIYY